MSAQLLAYESIRSDSSALLNGRNLTGWMSQGGDWKVEGGVLRASFHCSNGKSRLLTRQMYRDYELSGEYRLEQPGSAALCLRADPVTSGRPCIELKTDTSQGCPLGLYEWEGRGWIIRVETAAKAAFRPGNWNQLRLRVTGDSVRVWLNDQLLFRCRDSAIAHSPAAIGLQLDGNESALCYWRRLRIRNLSKAF
ncbi:MAG TPA: DUF1080 domain-containing protein [Chitinophagaceae bacterium]|nr:DUF1080 domain-containing protein [Chitinophagaceae bacterium]